MANRDQQIELWLLEEDEDILEGTPCSDDEESDHLEVQGENTDSEEDGDHDLGEFELNQTFASSASPAHVFTDEDEVPLSNLFYQSVDNTRWLKEQVRARRLMRQHNIVRVQSGPREIAKTKATSLDCLSLFLDDEIVAMITDSTNKRILIEQNKYSRDRDAKITDELEIKGLMGILYLCGSVKSGRENILQLFDAKKGTGMEAVYLTMNVQRFKFLMRNLRFDDPTTRAQRIMVDKLAPIRDLFQKIVKSFQKHYTPSSELTLDEQLIAYRGRCRFRQYIPNKPAKYGIKIFALVDCERPYTYNLEIYGGSNPGPLEISNNRFDVVLRVTEPIHGENRNVTMDNWFTSLEAAKKLFENKTTVVGTIRKDKREVPKAFRTTTNRTEFSSLFGFHENTTLVSYVPKKNKVVLLLSTVHNDGCIDESSGDKRKPDIITYYNRTKNGVDLVDKMCSLYDVARNSRRWPLTVFFNLMNISAINALCIYKANNGLTKVLRRQFLSDIALGMMKPLASRRMSTDCLPKILKLKISDFLGIPLDEQPQKVASSPRGGARGRCFLCGRKRNKTTRISCQLCGKFTCPDHCNYMCNSCYENHT
ncbi:unnamed protein product [Parnassius mnemosyne]|uniref:PiggyBac transposable element-derived protein domain-containing protein n=1 Tax=Parnassius mnemosyne TaxID=213953 RepID=A0AAV1LCZ9_9NEOP